MYDRMHTQQHQRVVNHDPIYSRGYSFNSIERKAHYWAFNIQVTPHLEYMQPINDSK